MDEPQRWPERSGEDFPPCTVYAVQHPFHYGVISRSDKDNALQAKKFSAINMQPEDSLPSEQATSLEHLNIMPMCFQFFPHSRSQM